MASKIWSHVRTIYKRSVRGAEFFAGSLSCAVAAVSASATASPSSLRTALSGSAFDQLKLLVDREGDNLAGPDWLGMLAAIGIVKGQPFTPDANTREILDRAAKTAYKTSRVIGFEEVVGGISQTIYTDRHWTNPFAAGTPSKPTGALNLSWINTAGGYLALDARINFFTDYYSVSPGMLSYTPGKGANYLMAFTDREGSPLSGGSNYRLSLPPKIPAGIFWSVTLYDAENASGRAPGDGYVTLVELTVGDRALQARSAMSFIVESEITLVGMFSQNGFQAIKEGAAVDIVFDNVPGRIYHARITAIPRGIGQGQVAASGTLARTNALGGATVYPAVISLPDGMTRFASGCPAARPHFQRRRA
jgi:Protein of unknown function (DUF1214)